MSKVDVSISENYDTDTQKIKIPDIGYGFTAKIKSETKLPNGELRFLCSVYPYEDKEAVSDISVVVTNNNQIKAVIEGSPKAESLSVSKLPTKIEYKKARR